jgi:hypothetical protein
VQSGQGYTPQSLRRSESGVEPLIPFSYRNFLIPNFVLTSVGCAFVCKASACIRRETQPEIGTTWNPFGAAISSKTAMGGFCSAPGFLWGWNVYMLDYMKQILIEVDDELSVDAAGKVTGVFFGSLRAGRSRQGNSGVPPEGLATLKLFEPRNVECRMMNFEVRPKLLRFEI